MQGDLVLRNGIYVTDTDIRLRLHGVLLKETGRIEANLEPLTPIRVDISGSDIHNGNADYRCVFRWALHMLQSERGREGDRELRCQHHQRNLLYVPCAWDTWSYFFQSLTPVFLFAQDLR
jgi:hypothetical protein